MAVSYQRLRQIRKAKGYSMPKLARESGVGRQTISDLELGKRNNGAEIGTLLALAEALGVKMTDLFEVVN